MSLLPSRPDTSAAEEAAPSVVGVDSERADALMAALSSGTARDLLTALHEEPGPPSTLADRVGTSLQNAQYHLDRLQDAGAIEVVDTAYSEKGREMDIYAPADRPLVIFAGREDQSRSLRAAIRELVTGVAALAVASLVVQELFGRSVASLLGRPGGAGGGSAGGGDAGGGPPPAAETATPTPSAAETASTNASGGGATATPAPTEAAAETVRETTAEPDLAATATATQMETARSTAAGGADAVAQLPPGVLFFMGGLLVLVVIVALVR